MNTKDFKVLNINDFSSVFSYQKKVFLNFMKLESKDFDLNSFDINCLQDQQMFKDFLEIRFVEELTEASSDMNDQNHFKEEIIDAFNFLLESYILYGWKYSDLDDWEDDARKVDRNYKKNIGKIFYPVIEKVGSICNILKNRPWKFSQYLIDLGIFEKKYQELWKDFNLMCNKLGIFKKELIDIWSLKYQVNIFRIRTKY